MIILGNQFDKTQTIKNLLKENNLQPSETAYICSQTNSMQLTKKNNLISIVVLGGQKSKGSLKKENPNHILNSIDELQKLIK